MSASVVYYPLAGFCIGLLATIPVLLGLWSEHHFVQAWLYVLLNAWLTRALHLDGLADVLDAVGSGKHGDAFREVLKDSRMGAFGAAGLVLAVGGQCILVAATLESETIAPLIFAPIYGRCLPIVLVCVSSPYSNTGLGALLSVAPKRACLAVALLAGLIGGFACLGVTGFFAALVFTLPPFFFLLGLARKEGGYNGDFLGFAIIAGEIAVLLGYLAS